MNEPLADLAFQHSTSERTRISRSSVAAFLEDLEIEVRNLDTLIEQAVLIQRGGDERSALEMRIGGWTLDLPTAVARGVINGAVLAALLAAVDESSVPATVLSVVVPFVFDLQRISISRSDRSVYAILLSDPWGRQSIGDWYRSLPDHIKEELTMLEFVDLIERLEDAGLVESDDYEVVTIDSPSPRRIARLGLPQEGRNG